MSQSAQFDPIDFTEQWACKQDGSFLGNFPESFYYHTDNHGYMLSSEPDAWTTFPTKEAKHYLDDHSEPLSKPWPNSSVPFGFHVKPGAYGPENRIIIQLALDDKSPTRPPYNNATETVVQYSEDLVEVELPRYTQRGYGTMWELMKKGVFNCHINRHLSLWDLQFSDNRTVRQLFQRKQRAEERVRELKEKDLCDHGNLKDDCEREMYLINEVPYDFFHLKKEQFACGVQVDYPLCCYASWQNHTDSIAKHMGGEYEWGKGGQCKGRVRVTKDDLLFDKKECDLYVDEGSPKSNNTQISEKVLFHERPECNFVFVRSRKSCLVSESDEGGGGMRPFAYPCVASCYTSIVLQVEIVPLEEAPAEFYLTAVVRRFHRLSQPPRNVAVADDKGEHRFFGYNARLSHHRTDYLGAKVDNGFSDANKTFSTERYVGVWFAWENRTRENKKENIEGKGPFLKVTKWREEVLCLIDLKPLSYRLVKKVTLPRKWYWICLP